MIQMAMRYAHLAAVHEHDAVNRVDQREPEGSSEIRTSGSGEMADALGLGPSGAIRGGSSPFSRTRIL